VKSRIFIIYCIIFLSLPFCANADVVYQVIDLGTPSAATSVVRLK